MTSAVVAGKKVRNGLIETSFKKSRLLNTLSNGNSYRLQVIKASTPTKSRNKYTPDKTAILSMKAMVVFVNFSDRNINQGGRRMDIKIPSMKVIKNGHGCRPT